MATLCLRLGDGFRGILIALLCLLPASGLTASETADEASAPSEEATDTSELAPGEAEYLEALRYFEGDEVPQSDRKGVSLLKKAEKLGYLPAANYLGICYQTGKGMLFSHERKGFRVLLEAAEAGHLPAMYNVAHSYVEGTGTDEDATAAAEWYQRAIDTEIPEDLPAEEFNFLSSVKGDACGQLGSLYLDEEKFAEAYTVFRQGAGWEDIHSQINAAHLRAVGKGTEANLTEAEGLLEAARRNISARFRRIADAYYSEALLGDTEAYYLEQEARKQAEDMVRTMRVAIANELADDEELVSDPDEAVKWFRLAAESDSPYAAGRLGLFYLQGREDLVSQEEAKELLTHAAKRSVPAACHGLGIYYTKVEPNPEEAAKWFHKAANLGYYVSAKALEDPTFQRPILFLENKELAMAAAETGDADAQYATGLFYWRGWGVDEDDAAAEKMFALAAQQGHPGAHYYLGITWFYGYTSAGLFKNNQTEGRKEIETATDLDYAEAHNQLGWLYENGNSVDTSISTAISHYEKAIALDPESFAHVRLGRVLAYKYQIDRRRAEALTHFQVLAELENSTAMMEIGKLYREGIGVEKDPAKAREWFEKAIDRDDNREALYQLGEMCRFGEGAEPDLKEALGYLERAASANHPDALPYVAEAYAKAINGARYRPKVASRFYIRLLNMRKWEYLEPYYGTLVATDEWDLLKDYLGRLPNPENDAANDYFCGLSLIHFADRDVKDYQWGLKRLLNAFEDGYNPGAAAYLRALQRYPRAPRKLEETLKDVRLRADPDSLCELALLQQDKPDWFPEATPESIRAQLISAAKAGSMQAACVLAEEYLKATTDADEAPSYDQLVAWLEPFAERGFEVAADVLERLRDSRATEEESDGDPEATDTILDERLASLRTAPQPAAA